MKSRDLIEAVAEVGRRYPARPALQEVEIFTDYFDEATGNLRDLERRDGSCTRRELLLRYLLLNAVLDQGPDSEGVRLLLVRVTNDLYRRDVRFLQKPEEFFRELGIAVDQITDMHEVVKRLRAEDWAKANQTRPTRYNLFLDNTRQVLNYAVFRWGTPLAVPLLLTKDAKLEADKPTILLRHLESWSSAEEMSRQLKDHPRYGLGKAIGNKAAHLFAKWIVHSYPLVTRTDKPWGPFGFEVPFDSNAGRVLFRTGFFTEWATLKEYESWQVIRRNVGKGGKHYIRVTNIRGKPSLRAENDPDFVDVYRNLCVNYLRPNRRPPRRVEIQRIPLAILLAGERFTPGELDDGLMYVGTRFCFNHDQPLCSKCPVRHHCVGYESQRSLILDYRT